MSVRVPWTADRTPVRKKAYMVRYHSMTDGDGDLYYDNAVFIGKDAAEVVTALGGSITQMHELGPAGREPACVNGLESGSYPKNREDLVWLIDDEALVWWKARDGT